MEHAWFTFTRRPVGKAVLALAMVMAIGAGSFDAAGDPMDWPMWQYDEARDATNMPLQLPNPYTGTMHLQWVRELPEPERAWPFQRDDRGKLDFDVSFAPVVVGTRIFVPSNVTDSVTAYSTADGAELWRFYADGPVRLAPAVSDGKVYFVSDDGHLYCVDAANGELNWKFRGGPTNHTLLGNERIINFWGARGGPVVYNGKVYFAAGFWPLHGIFVYALDAQSGDVIWVNDRTSSDYVNLPHGGASGYGGLAPQGYLAVNADDNRLVVSGGRNMPAFLNLNTGNVVSANYQVKPDGGYAVHDEGQGWKNNTRLTLWASRLRNQVDGDIYYTLAAHDKFYITTTTGRLYCFSADSATPVHHTYEPVELTPETGDWAQTAQDLLDELGDSEGYALVLGAGSGDLMRELILRSNLHVVTIEADGASVQDLRDELVDAGMYGRRAAVIEADPALFTVQPYLFSLVVSEDAEAAGITPDAAVWEPILNRLMPYKGLAYLGATSTSAMVSAAETADVDQVSVESQGNAVFAQRSGPLTGAGEWTHQLQGPSNTVLSKDERVRLPLGILWFGGPNNHDILPRHAGGPRPQVAGGRQVYLGVETIGARCVYSGRQLWRQDFPGIGHPFTNLSLEASWANGSQVYMDNIPGATYIGSPYVTLSDSIYLRYQGQIYHLDPTNGETVGTYSLPTPSNPDWGHMSVHGDYLITTAEPHFFEDQDLGRTNSYSGTSSGRLVVMNRHTGAILWQRSADIAFRHNAIISSDDTMFVIDGLSENAVDFSLRRGTLPDEPSVIYALNIESGAVIWEENSNVFGTFLAYSDEHDVLVEGGSVDMRAPFSDEPRNVSARQGSDGTILWQRGGSFSLPGAIRDDMLIPGRPGTARSLLTGEDWRRIQPHTGEQSNWTYNKAYGCGMFNASQNLLLFRTGYAGFFDLEYDSGTGNFSGFRAACTANMIAAEGVLNALDYTRTCTCSYQNQTSLAMIHMPEDSTIEMWTRYDASTPNPLGYGVNFGAPGRRADPASGRVWHDEPGTARRHASSITANGGGVDWVAASYRQLNGEYTVHSLIPTDYTVRLHFAEHDESVQPGQRVFDVLIDGSPVLTGYDIVAETGGALIGTVEEFGVNTGMTMSVELRKSANSELDPIISGIELISGEVPTAQVPDLVGQNLQDARDMLASEGLNVGSIEFVQSDPEDHEKVLSQDPQPGVELDAGSAVDLTVGYAAGYIGVQLYGSGTTGVLSDALPPDLGIDGSNPKTVELWVCLTGTWPEESSYLYYTGRQSSSEGGRQFSIRTLSAPDNFRAQVHSADPDFTHPALNRWVHFAMTSDGNELLIYANGEQVARRDGGVNGLDGGASPFAVGMQRVEDLQRTINGYVDDVRIWNVARTQAEIQASMHDYLTGDEEGLVLYWPLNGEQTTTALDATGNGHNGQLNDATWAVIPEAPNVMGLPLSTARSTLQNAGYTVEVEGEDDGVVESQNPIPGGRIVPGQTVVIVIGGDPVEVVPDVTNLPWDEAQAILEAAGFTVNVVEGAPDGLIVSQNPPPGGTIEPGGTVEIVVSEESPVYVPDLVIEGEWGTIADVEAQLNALGLTLGSITYASSSTVPEGFVMGQGVSAGTPLLPGSSVGVVVSSGPPAAMPMNILAVMAALLAVIVMATWGGALLYQRAK